MAESTGRKEEILVSRGKNKCEHDAIT